MPDLDINEILKAAGVMVPEPIHEVILRVYTTKPADINLTCTVMNISALNISVYPETQKGVYNVLFGSGWWVSVVVANERPTISAVNIQQAWWNVDPESQESLAGFEHNLRTIIANVTPPPVYR